MQTARIEDGFGNIIVQAVASSVTVGLPPQLKLSPRHRRKRAPKPGVDIDLLNPFTDAIPFIGREEDLARLQAWLVIPKPISARCLVGRAGTGKTRRALQLCELAEALAPAWDAGFVEHRELERFASLQNLSAWGWQRPTLMVIDYAAGVTRWLRPWLEELAQHSGHNGVPLRLLMLERFADKDLGWWANLTSTGQSNANIPELFDPPKPEPLYPIGAEHRTALVRAVIQAVQPDKADSGSGKSERVGKVAEGADAVDALDLMMAGLIAARQLAPAQDGRPWSRTAMATGVARHERSRIERLANDRNVSAATLEHLVAVVTLGCGIAIDAARSMIEEELVALPRRDSGSALDLRDVLRDALREPESERIPPVVPDLIGEAFVLNAFGKLTAAEQGEAVARSYRRSPQATAATLFTPLRTSRRARTIRRCDG